jgi:hypothetical protein
MLKYVAAVILLTPVVVFPFIAMFSFSNADNPQAASQPQQIAVQEASSAPAAPAAAQGHYEFTPDGLSARWIVGPAATQHAATIGRGKAKICATTDIAFDTFREIRLPPTTVFKDSGRLIGDIRTASLDDGNDSKLAAFITTDSVVLTKQRPCAEVGARMLIGPLFDEPSASASEKHRWAIDDVLDYPIPTNKPSIEIGKLIDDVSILGVLLTDVGDPLTLPKDETDEATNAARCLAEAQKVAAHEEAIIQRQTTLVVIMQHPAAAEMSFGCAKHSFKPDLYVAWDRQAKPSGATGKLIASAGEYLTGATQDELKQELAKCVTEALKPNSGELAQRESRGVKIECQAFARDGGGGSATIYRRFGDSPIRPAASTAATQPSTIEQNGSASKVDFLGVYAVLTSYWEVCIPKEDPPPLDKVVAVVHAARVAGIDVTTVAFKREAAPRIKNLALRGKRWVNGGETCRSRPSLSGTF